MHIPFPSPATFSQLAQVTNPVVQGGLGSNAAAAESGGLLTIIIRNSLAFVMAVATIFLLIQLIVAAFNWMGAGGDTSKVEKARNTITQAVIGIVILAAVGVIWAFVLDSFQISVGFSNLFLGSGS